jgi:hypothetical protein
VFCLFDICFLLLCLDITDLLVDFRVFFSVGSLADGWEFRRGLG